MVAAIMPIILRIERLRRCCQKATTNVHTIKEAAAEEDKLGRMGADNRVMVGGTYESTEKRIRRHLRTEDTHARKFATCIIITRFVLVVPFP